MCMKRILVIGMSDTLGGVETYLYNLIKTINKQQYKFDFLVIGQDNKSVFEKEINEIIGDGENHFYYCPNLKKEYLKAKRWLNSFYEKNHFDIIYLNTCTAARISYCVKGINSNTKLVTHSHNGKADNWKGTVTNALFKRYTTNKSVYKIACSDIAYKYLFSDIAHGNWFVPNGVDTNRFSFSEENRKKIRKQLNIGDDKIVIGNVGRFSAQKNQAYFLDLAQTLDDNYLFLLLGNGELKHGFIEKIKERGLEKKFIVLPSKNNVEEYYSAMDIFVMPSLFEGLPITAIEAQCNGISCIFSENITQQVSLSSHCKFVNLDEKEKWIHAIKMLANVRYDGNDVIKRNGFDISSTVKKIEMIFLEL